MPNIIIKAPLTNPKIIYVNSKTLSDLYQELGICGSSVNIGTGLLLITQINTEYDEPNVIYAEHGISGCVYCTRFTKDRIVEINENDLEYFESEVTYITSDYF